MAESIGRDCGIASGPIMIETPTLTAAPGMILLGAYAARSCPVKTQNAFNPTVAIGTPADGAPAGQYNVTLVWPDGLLDECEWIDPVRHDRLKCRYAKADQSKFQVTVTPSTNTFWFNVERPRPDRSLP